MIKTLNALLKLGQKYLYFNKEFAKCSKLCYQVVYAYYGGLKVHVKYSWGSSLNHYFSSTDNILTPLL